MGRTFRGSFRYQHTYQAQPFRSMRQLFGREQSTSCRQRRFLPLEGFAEIQSCALPFASKCKPETTAPPGAVSHASSCLQYRQDFSTTRLVKSDFGPSVPVEGRRTCLRQPIVLALQLRAARECRLAASAQSTCSCRLHEPFRRTTCSHSMQTPMYSSFWSGEMVDTRAATDPRDLAIVLMILFRTLAETTTRPLEQRRHQYSCRTTPVSPESGLHVSAGGEEELP